MFHPIASSFSLITLKDMGRVWVLRIIANINGPVEAVTTLLARIARVAAVVDSHSIGVDVLCILMRHLERTKMILISNAVRIISPVNIITAI